MVIITQELSAAELLDMLAARVSVAVEFLSNEFCEIKSAVILPWSGYLKITCYNKYTRSCKLSDTLTLRFED
jgi:hypothetical protein